MAKSSCGFASGLAIWIWISSASRSGRREPRKRRCLGSGCRDGEGEGEKRPLDRATHRKLGKCSFGAKMKRDSRTSLQQREEERGQRRRVGVFLGAGGNTWMLVDTRGSVRRGKDFKEHHEQKAYEREMQRVTLPLSAFTNPTCEIVDEVIVVHSQRTPVEDAKDGNAPLMGQAGTPGA